MKSSKLFYLSFLAFLVLIALSNISYAREVSEGSRGSDSSSIDDDSSPGVKLRSDGSIDDDQTGSVNTSSSVKLRGDGTIDDDSNDTASSGVKLRGDGTVDDNSSGIAEQHRSSVSTFVQNILNLSDDRSEIGKQVREIAQEQNGSKEEIAQAVEKIEKRSRLKTFLFGSDFKNIGEIRSKIVSTDNKIEKLNKLLASSTVTTLNVSIKAEIEKLEIEQQKLNDFLVENEAKFSLLGWAVKLFSN